MAMLIVLLLLAVGTIVGASLLSDASLSSITARGFSDSMEARYLAESAAQHAACLLLENPSAVMSADGGKFGPYELDNGGGHYSFAISKLTTPGYFEVSASADEGDSSQSVTAVYRHTWGRQVMIKHALLSTSDAAYLYTSFNSRIYGPVHANFYAYNVGDIIGDISACGTVTNYGTVNNGQIEAYAASVLAPVFTPGNYDYYAWGDEVGEAIQRTDNYFNRYEDISGWKAVTEENPAGVVVVRPSSGFLQIQSGFDFRGTLVVHGDVLITGTGIDLDARDSFPALIVTGGIYFNSNTSLDVEGVVYSAMGMLPNDEAYGCHTRIKGALICESIGVYPMLYGEHIIEYDADECSLLDPSGYGTGGEIALYDWRH